MSPHDLAREVLEAFARSGHAATLTLTMPGRRGKGAWFRFCRAGPIGRIVAEPRAGQLVVSFDAVDLAAFLTANGFMRSTVVRRDDVPGGVIVFQVADDAPGPVNRLTE